MKTINREVLIREIYLIIQANPGICRPFIHSRMDDLAASTTINATLNEMEADAIIRGYKATVEDSPRKQTCYEILDENYYAPAQADVPSTEFGALKIFKRLVEIHNPEFQIDDDILAGYASMLGSVPDETIDKILQKHSFA
jgi:hypothetical protein